MVLHIRCLWLCHRQRICNTNYCFLPAAALWGALFIATLSWGIWTAISAAGIRTHGTTLPVIAAAIAVTTAVSAVVTTVAIAAAITATTVAASISTSIVAAWAAIRRRAFAVASAVAAWATWASAAWATLAIQFGLRWHFAAERGAAREVDAPLWIDFDDHDGDFVAN